MSWRRTSTHTLFTIAVGLLVLIAGRSGCTANARARVTRAGGADSAPPAERIAPVPRDRSAVYSFHK